jgi:hypothetical protein
MQAASGALISERRSYDYNDYWIDNTADRPVFCSIGALKITGKLFCCMAQLADPQH